MDRCRIAFLSAIVLGLLAACGGGGGGFSVAADPLVVTSSTIDPTLVSGDAIDWEIPLGGGCSGVGPYVVEVISGALPPGVGTDDDGGRHHLVGNILADGNFAFTIKVTDASCQPFATTTMRYVWRVAEGPVRIVACDPPLVPVASIDDTLKYPDADGLETVVYSSFVTYDFVVAGGVAPYSCTLIDDPADPDDGALPIGLSFAVNSCSLVGSPTQVGPNGRPFRYTIRVTDAVGNTSVRKFQHKIDTPAIILPIVSLQDGKAGRFYSDSVKAVDGVPPIAYELTDNAPGDDGDTETTDNVNDDITYTAGAAPTINAWVNAALPFQLTTSGPAGDNAKLHATLGRVGYPAESASGPDYTNQPMPPEGISFRTSGAAAGNFSGTPRRRGDFLVNVHAYSTLVPNERGQHAFKQLPLHIDMPDALAMNPSFTVEGEIGTAAAPTSQTADGYSSLPEVERGVLYNPDGGANGMELLAAGGVPMDRKSDQPHAEDVIDPVAGEIAGRYHWSANMNVDGSGEWGSVPAALDVFVESGVFGTQTSTKANSLFTGGRRLFDITVTDDSLPTTIRPTITNRFGTSVGPDTAIITYSTKSETGIDFYYASSSRFGMNDTALQIQKFQLLTSGASRKELEDSDMPATHSVPSIAGVTGSNQLGALLSGVTTDGGSPTGGAADLDLLRCVVNATGWWDDQFQMNPKGARPFAHCDPNVTDRPYGQFGYSYTSMGNFQPPCSSVDLPDVDPAQIGVPAAAHKANGIYTTGGLCYHFESDKQYGLFIVRPDAKVYVPFAEAKPAVNGIGFGDGMLFDKAAAQHSSLRTVQMTVSPDGRFAAMKLKKLQTDLYEHADDSRILFVSLTGEKCFGESSPGANDGATYRIVTLDATTLTGAGNRIFYASSMALTNSHLYFLIGTESPTSNTDTSSARLYLQSWHGHHILRCAIEAGSPAKLTSADPDWTNDDSPATTVQTVFHHHGPNYSSSSTYWGLVETSTTYGLWPYHRYFQEDGMNFHEHNVAPAPFRVSANGKAVAFFAGPDTTATSGTDVYSNYAWVDYEAGGAIQVTETRRHHSTGSARGYQIFQGPSEYSHWGRYHGPTPGVEISDDGLAVAFHYNTNSSISASASYSISDWRLSRENVILTRSTSGTWAAKSETDVTTNCFGGSHRWRFGSLAFTADGGGLVFWGGAPVYDATTTSYTYMQSMHFAGAYYVHKIGDTDKVTSMLATADGGSPDGAGKEYGVGSGLSAFSPTSTSGINNRYGAVHPFGGFMSRNRSFMYVHNLGALSSSEQTGGKLVGLQVATADGAAINGHAAGRGFVPANWPSRRGFTPSYYYYYGHYGPHYYGYMPSHATGMGQQVMAKDTGWVFFQSNYQYSGPANSGSVTYGQYVYPTYYGYGYAYGGNGIYGFNADMGGAMADLSKPAWNPSSTGTYGFPSLLEVSRDGKRLMNVYLTYYITYPYRNREQVRCVHNIDFDTANGAIHSGFSQSNDTFDLEASDGRAGAAMAVVNGGRDVYYAFGPASNENGKNLIRQRWNEATQTWTKTATTGTAGTGRINVLWAAR